MTKLSCKASFSWGSTQGIIDSAYFRFLQRLYIIFGFRRDCPRTFASCRGYCPRKMASSRDCPRDSASCRGCRDCPRDSASCREPQQEAESRGQSLQEAIYHVQKSWQEARDRGQSQRKPNMMYSLCRMRKLAESIIPCAPAHRGC